VKERIRIIGNRLISESFPVLQTRKVHFITLRFRFYAVSFWIPFAARIIVISTRTRNFSDMVLTGILAHELSHQERYLSMGKAGYIIFAFRYIFSKKLQADEERATDRLTIDKGYGRQLYDLTLISHKDENHKSILDNYLTPGEIKEYAMEAGKW
jgi:hypothetical protein